uniref:Tyrosine-protein phosphatase domain-containing protein n=1 Tax=Trichuris muris TaxID=70415 RepID=A0A5S6R0P6_TRIMR
MTSPGQEEITKTRAVQWASEMLKDCQKSIHNISSEFFKLQAETQANGSNASDETKGNSICSDGHCADSSNERKVKERRHKRPSVHSDRVNLPELPCEFILAKALSQETIVDLWTTVWKEYVKVIVYIEDSEACKSDTIEPYWPKMFGVNEHHTYGKFQIRAIYGQVTKSYTHKILEIQDMESNETRWVRHLVYADWPREEAALSTETLFDLMNKVDEQLEKGKKDSMVYPFRVLVHDTVSTLRSGTFVVLRSLIGAIRIGLTPLVSPTVSILLHQQARSIREVKLYYYIYYALIKYIMTHWDIPEDIRNDWQTKAKLMRKKCNDRSTSAFYTTVCVVKSALHFINPLAYDRTMFRIPGTDCRPKLFILQRAALLQARHVCTTSMLLKTQAGKHKSTRFRTKPLTYEMAQKPDQIGVRKAWLTWHTSNLEEIGIRSAKAAIEDEIVRRMIRGIWPNLFASELVIKRRGNVLFIAGIVERRISSSKMYWLIGFTEELLALLLKQPVKLELSTIADKQEIVFKYI